MTDSVAFFLINKFFSLGELIVKLGIPAWALVEIMPYLAGKETTVMMYLEGTMFSKSSSWVTFAIIVLLLWAILERRLRQSKTVTLTERIAELETRLNPNRTSSGLTPQGLTHPKDKVL